MAKLGGIDELLRGVGRVLLQNDGTDVDITWQGGFVIGTLIVGLLIMAFDLVSGWKAVAGGPSTHPSPPCCLACLCTLPTRLSVASSLASLHRRPQGSAAATTLPGIEPPAGTPCTTHPTACNTTLDP